MKSFALAVATTLACSAISFAADESKPDVKAINGTWKIKSVELDGKKANEEMGFPDKAVIKDGEATFFKGEGMWHSTFGKIKLEFDPTKKPKTVEVLWEKENLPGIYELAGDEFKLALPVVPLKGKPSRPESFSTLGKPVVTFIMTRSKE